MERPKVVVIGAGIIGLSSAFVIKQAHPEYDVTLVAEEYSPNVTSDGAAGYWFPAGDMGSTPWELQMRWSLATRNWLKQLFTQPDSFINGISLASGYVLEDHYPTIPRYKDLFPDFRILTEEELCRFPKKVKAGFFVTTLVCESSKYLPFLLKRFIEMGGKTIKKKITSFEELKDFNIVVNCTGLNAKELCQDNELYPIRGQILRVKAPWIRHFYRFLMPSEGKYVYIFPNIDFVTLGGTKAVGDYNMEVVEKDRKLILEATSQIEPSIKMCGTGEDWVGLRPGRSSVRLEKDVHVLADGNELKIVHNYGHGRFGITLHYGCALDTLALIQDSLRGWRNTHAETKSKL